MSATEVSCQQLADTLSQACRLGEEGGKASAEINRHHQPASVTHKAPSNQALPLEVMQNCSAQYLSSIGKQYTEIGKQYSEIFGSRKQSLIKNFFASKTAKAAPAKYPAVTENIAEDRLKSHASSTLRSANQITLNEPTSSPIPQGPPPPPTTLPPAPRPSPLLPIAEHASIVPTDGSLEDFERQDLIDGNDLLDEGKHFTKSPSLPPSNASEKRDEAVAADDSVLAEGDLLKQSAPKITVSSAVEGSKSPIPTPVNTLLPESESLRNLAPPTQPSINPERTPNGTVRPQEPIPVSSPTLQHNVPRKAKTDRYSVENCIKKSKSGKLAEESWQPPLPDPSALKTPTTLSSRCLTGYKLLSDFSRQYRIGDELGTGGFGFVVSALRVSDSQEVAVKFIFKDKVPSRAWVKDVKLGVVPIEIYVLKNVRHPSIIRYLDYFDDARYYYLVMELHGTPWSARSSEPPLGQEKRGDAGAEDPIVRNSATNSDGGDKTTRMQPVDPYPKTPVPSSAFLEPPRAAAPDGGKATRPGMIRRTSCDLFECIEHHSQLSEKDSSVIFRQLVDSVLYLKSIGICHRDLKDENILVDEQLKVKLIDFGSSVITATKSVYHRFYGTINYASPEILRGEPYVADAAEVWSLGILLYTLLYGEVPFDSPERAISKGYLKPRTQSSPECLDLLNLMLAKDASKRVTIEQIGAHRWLNKPVDEP